MEKNQSVTGPGVEEGFLFEEGKEVQGGDCHFASSLVLVLVVLTGDWRGWLPPCCVVLAFSA